MRRTTRQRALRPSHDPQPDGGSARMRVVFLTFSLECGGSETQLVELLSRIDPATVEATLATISPRSHGRLAQRVVDSGVPQVVLARDRGSRPRRYAQAARELRRLLQRLRPDVVYAWGECSALVAAPVARRHGIPLVVARRNTVNVALGPVVARAARWVERRAALVTVNSTAARDEAARCCVPRERLRLVPNGHEAGIPAPLPSGDEIRLGYVARLSPGKGHMRLFQALREVRAKASWRVDLAGTGPLLEDLRAAVSEGGLAERVRFLGALDDIPRFWQEHHACLLLSDYEGSSNALIEAGLSRRALVATDVPGNHELLTPGSGILVHGDDPAGTARTIQQIIDDAELRERLGRGAREAMKRFDADQMVAKHLEALAECGRAAGSASAQRQPAERRWGGVQPVLAPATLAPQPAPGGAGGDPPG